MPDHQLTFQFLSEPTDVNFGGSVHGGTVMKWIDQTAYACARNWSGSYCVTIYVGGIRFYKGIKIGDVVRLDASVIYTGNTSIHIAVDVSSKTFEAEAFEKKTHCIIVFVALDAQGKPTPVPQWKPVTDQQRQLERYAVKLMDLRRTIEEEMQAYLP